MQIGMSFSASNFLTSLPLYIIFFCLISFLFSHSSFVRLFSPSSLSPLTLSFSSPFLSSQVWTSISDAWGQEYLLGPAAAEHPQQALLPDAEWLPGSGTADQQHQQHIIQSTLYHELFSSGFPRPSLHTPSQIKTLVQSRNKGQHDWFPLTSFC